MRLIDRDSLKHQIIETYEYEFPTASGAFDEFATKIIPNIINNAPTIDAVPVVRGEWVKKSSEEAETLALCSECSYPISWWYKSNYCPNCGAKMEDKP